MRNTFEAFEGVLVDLADGFCDFFVGLLECNDPRRQVIPEFRRVFKTNKIDLRQMRGRPHEVCLRNRSTLHVDRSHSEIHSELAKGSASCRGPTVEFYHGLLEEAVRS
jgi:hypothetical protein